MKNINTEKYLRKLWTHKMDVSRYVNRVDATGLTIDDNIKLVSDIDCRLSFKSSTYPIKETVTGDEIKYYPTLFCATNVNIKKGDLITVKVGDITYKGYASRPKFYINSHQEIILKELVTLDE